MEKAYIRSLWRDHFVTKASTFDGTLVESHYVLGERASLVGEDVLDLAELFVQRGRPRLRRGVVGQVVHLSVPVY